MPRYAYVCHLGFRSQFKTRSGSKDNWFWPTNFEDQLGFDCWGYLRLQVISAAPGTCLHTIWWAVPRASAKRSCCTAPRCRADWMWNMHEIWIEWWWNIEFYYIDIMVCLKIRHPTIQKNGWLPFSLSKWPWLGILSHDAPAMSWVPWSGSVAALRRGIWDAELFNREGEMVTWWRLVNWTILFWRLFLKAHPKHMNRSKKAETNGSLLVHCGGLQFLDTVSHASGLHSFINITMNSNW